MWKFFAKETLLEIARSLVIPAVVTGGGVMIGWLSGIPLFHIYVGTVALFALTVLGLLRFTEWMDRITPEHKLAFGGVRVAAKRPDESQEIKELCIGIQLRNFAEFPITFKLQHISSQIGDCYPPRKAYELDKITVPPRSNGWFDDHMILLNSSPRGQTLEGVIEFKISYGKEGRKRPFILTGRKKALINFPAGDGPPHAEWFDTSTTLNQGDK